MKKTLKTLIPAFALALVLTGCADDCDDEMENTTEASSAAVTPGSQADLASDGKNKVFFDFDKATLNSESQKDRVKAQSEWLKMYPKAATVTGYADKRGTAEYNLALGTKRAEAVKKHLVKHGVTSELQIASKGSEMAGDHADEAGFAQDRFAETVVAE